MLLASADKTSYLHRQLLRCNGRFVVKSRMSVSWVPLTQSAIRVSDARLADGLLVMLPSGGHNAGTVRGFPEHPRRRYPVHTRKSGDKFIAAQDWFDKMAINQGSWWPRWNAWLNDHTGVKVTAPSMGAAKKVTKRCATPRVNTWLVIIHC